jgi:hypothetical protein
MDSFHGQRNQVEMMHNPWSVTLESNSGLADRKMIDTCAAHILIVLWKTKTAESRA